MDEDSNVLPDLKDLETKLGRKVPESLIRSLVGGKHHEKHEKSTNAHLVNCKSCTNSSDLKRLEKKMLFLKQEMVSLLLIRVLMALYCHCFYVRVIYTVYH